MQVCNTNIKENIIEYLKDENEKQAILIDGEWGCGKTFFIKKEIIHEIDESKIDGLKNKKTIYISLYGVKDSKEITNEIYTNILYNKISKSNSKDMKRTLNLSSKFLKPSLKIFNIFLEDKLGDKVDIIELFKELGDSFKVSDFFEISDENIIIFDDLERCKMGINEILGYINNLVEHNKLKVIVIANEKEIGKLYININLEQKYSIILSDKLLLDGKDNSNKNNNDESKKITKEDLEKYTNDLFKTDLIYKEIKEKLIGFTIKFEPNIDILLPELIKENISDENTKKIIDRNKSKLVSVIKENKNFNLRTIIFSLRSFEKLNKVIYNKYSEEKYIDKIIDEVCLYCMESAIHIKNGKKICIYDKYLPGRTRIKEYKFVDEFLLNRVIADNMYEILDNQINVYKEIDENEERKNLSLYKLYDLWWFLEDDEIDEYIKNLKVELETEKYKIEEFKWICILILQLEHNDLGNEEFKKIKTIMLQQAERNNDNVNIDLLNMYTTDEDFKEKYNELVNPIIRILQDKEIKEEIDFNDRIKNIENWGEIFYDFCNDKLEIINKYKGFFKFIDINNLRTVLLDSSNRDIYYFRDTIKEIYKYNMYKDDVTNINEFIKNIKFDDIQGVTKKIALKSLKKELEEDLKKV